MNRAGRPGTWWSSLAGRILPLALIIGCMGVLCPQSEPTVIDGFQLEWMGGLSLANPRDLNLQVWYDQALQDLTVDQYHDYLLQSGQIASWNRLSDGEPQEIRMGIPFGLRVRYNINDRWAVSLGLHYISLGRSGNFIHEYERQTPVGTRFSYRYTHDLYRLTANGFSPLAGIHYKHRFSDALLMEGYFSLGPVVANCRYENNQLFEWLYNESTEPYVLFDQTRKIKEVGRGIGLAASLGVRLNMAFHKKWDIFVEAGYHLRVINRVTGRGSEEIDAYGQDWDGRWIVVREQVVTDWGTATPLLPTNLDEGWPEEQVVRDFTLNLSGFQVSVGLSFKFKVIIEPRY